MRGKKRLGRRYWLRLVPLFFLTGFVTWYSKQDHNNPFKSHPSLQIYRKDHSLFIECQQQIQSSSPIDLLFIYIYPTSKRYINDSLNLPKTPLLITQGFLPEVNTYAGNSPLQWVILDSSHNQDWYENKSDFMPIPQCTDRIIGENDISAQLVYPFANTEPCVHLSYKSIDLLIITKIPTLNHQDKDTFFKEQFDLLVLSPPSITQEAVLKIRHLLRPIYCVAVPEKPISDFKKLKELDNILIPEQATFTYTFYQNNKQRLLIKNRN